MGVTVVHPDAMCIFGLTPKPPQGLDIATARIVGPSLPILVDLHRGSTECRASEKSVVTAGYSRYPVICTLLPRRYKTGASYV
jgi:hypothetical protein